MLHELHIRNFAIIDELHLVFRPGLNILTGETGAGKSIIIDAVGLLLGDRAGAEWVRAGTEVASIEATFVLPTAPANLPANPPAPVVENDEKNGKEDGEGAPLDVRDLLVREGLDDPDSPASVTLAREVRTTGRNICRINGRAVSLQLLADVAGALIDIHGQGEHLNLLRPRTHVHLLDRYANLLPLRDKVAAQVSMLRSVRAALQQLRQDARTVAQRIDMLSYQAEEIHNANLRPGEDGDLEGERRRLANAEALLKLAQSAQAYLAGGEGELPAALDLVGEAVSRMEKLARIDPDLADAAAETQALLEQLADSARMLEDYAESLEFNPVRLAEVEERLELLVNLKRKYGDTIEQIIDFGRRAQDELEALSNWEARSADLEKQEDALLHTIGALATELSAQRQAAGERLARAVEAELGDLKMERARFALAVEQTPHADGAFLPDGHRVAFDSTGIDQVEFLISANPGEPLKPMAKVASGGETARLMLALKGTLAHADATPTLIFDEIDQGIGGRVGGVVGYKLWNLTERRAPLATPSYNGNAPDGAQEPDNGMAHQVLVITHLPQLAAYGDAHYTVNKQVHVENGVERTTTIVQALDAAARVAELTQMLGAPGEVGRLSIEEMLREVAVVKQRAPNRR
jgi:DNA repair protein RecN (Recombination protein N)